MKKIVAILALTLCAMYDCSAMLNPIRQNMSRFGQYARQYVPQAAQTCRTFASKASNLRPQNFGWLRNIPTYARNVNLPSMRTAAIGLGGLGLGTAAYLQGPELFSSVKAEEMPSDVLNNTTSHVLNDIRSRFYEITHRSYSNKELQHLKLKLKQIATIDKQQMNVENRKNFTAIVNDILNILKRDKLSDELKQEKENAAQIYNDTAGLAGTIQFLSKAIFDDIALVNTTENYSDIQSDQNIEIPNVYKRFFGRIGKNDDLTFEFLKAIDIMKVYTPELNRVLDEISKEITKSTPSSWWWPF